uniref:Uncharacterized protein n=1 Tax=Anguilla anguilla TaxID=7936 RepID=A0A0E9UEJ7_ANGAN
MSSSSGPSCPDWVLEWTRASFL